MVYKLFFTFFYCFFSRFLLSWLHFKAKWAIFFKVVTLALEHLLIRESSIQKFIEQEKHTLDAISFIKEFRETLGIPTTKMPVYLENIRI